MLSVQGVLIFRDNLPKYFEDKIIFALSRFLGLTVKILSKIFRPPYTYMLDC